MSKVRLKPAYGMLHLITYVVGVPLKLVNIIEVDMPYVNKPRPYKKEYKQQVARGEADERLARARARYSIDKKGYRDWETVGRAHV